MSLGGAEYGRGACPGGPHLETVFSEPGRGLPVPGTVIDMMPAMGSLTPRPGRPQVPVNSERRCRLASQYHWKAHAALTRDQGLIVHPPGGTIVAKDRGDDLHVVVDRSADKIERSLKRLKDKLSERRARREEALPADEGADEEDQSYEDILRVLLEEDEK